MSPPGPIELCDSGKKEAENGDSPSPELQLEPVIQNESNVPLELEGHPIMARLIPYPEVGVEMQVDALGPDLIGETPASVAPCEESTGENIGSPMRYLVFQ